MRALIASLLLCLTSAAWSQNQQATPTLSGSVTRVASGSDFDVNGIRVLCSPSTVIASRDAVATQGGCPIDPPVLGQSVDIYGHSKKKLNSIAAERIDF